MTAQPRDIALGFFEDINTGRFDLAMARLAPDVVYAVVSPPPHGGTFDRDGLMAFFGRYLSPKFTGPMQVEVTGVTAKGERVAIETKNHTPGKDGHDYDNRFHVLMIVRDGMIVDVREYLNSARLVNFITS